MPTHSETASAPRTARQHGRTLTALFMLSGLVMGSWLTRTPDLRDALDASIATMGLVLFGMSIGSMSGILKAPRATRAWGASRVITYGLSGVVTSALLIGISAALPTPLLGQVCAAGGLFAFGFGLGLAEVAMNVEAAAVENALGRPFLVTLHGFFSAGLAVGAVIGMAGTAARVPVSIHLTAIGLAGVPSLLLLARRLPRYSTALRDFGHRAVGEDTATKPGVLTTILKSRRMAAIGLTIFGVALAEGAAYDWLPILMVDDHGLHPSLSSAFFAGFTAVVAVARFTSSALVRRLGPESTLACGCGLAAVGMLVTAIVDHPAVVLAAVLAWAAGVSLGFPLAMSVAGGRGPDATARVAAAATCGYVALLVGPPILGFVGEHTSLRVALALPIFAVGLAALAAAALSRSRHPTHEGSLTSALPVIVPTDVVVSDPQ